MHPVTERTGIIVGAIGLDGLLLAIDTNAGIIAGAITVIGGSLIGLLALGIRQLGPLWADAKANIYKQWLISHKDSLAEKLERAETRLLEAADHITMATEGERRAIAAEQDCIADRQDLRGKVSANTAMIAGLANQVEECTRLAIEAVRESTNMAQFILIKRDVIRPGEPTDAPVQK